MTELNEKKKKNSTRALERSYMCILQSPRVKIILKLGEKAEVISG